MHRIGVGRFRILGGGGGPRFRILGRPGGGANSQQGHDVVTTSMRRNDVASTSFRRHVPTWFLITSIAAAAGGSRRHLPKAGVERSSYVGIAYTISVRLSN